ncbi:MAG: hypothetical protein HYZ53_18575 [Planctomycetes bacterium]|nr:hypothetical protein [Planctomycetota bacterium]
MRRLLQDCRGQGTVEFAMMLTVYVAITFGLLVVSELGIVAKRVQTESRVVAWNSLCTDDVDVVGVKFRLEGWHPGEVTQVKAEEPAITPESVKDVDDGSEPAGLVIRNCLRRMEGTVAFEYRPPWKLVSDDLQSSQDSIWEVARHHQVTTRSTIPMLPPKNERIVPLPPRPPSSGGGGNSSPPRRSNPDPPEPQPIP